MPSLATILEDDLGWREAELASLKIAIAKSSADSTARKALLRSLWAMLYAHFEGFCKYAWDVYLDQLQALGRARADFIDPLLAFSLARRFRSLRGEWSDSELWQFFNSELAALLSENIKFEDRFSKSENLWPDTVRQNSGSIGLSLTEVDRHDTALRSLVSRRNDIAHGKRMFISNLDEYSKYEDAALGVMYQLALELIEASEKTAYLATSQSGPGRSARGG